MIRRSVFLLCLVAMAFIPQQTAVADDLLSDEPLIRDLPPDPCPTYDSCTMFVWWSDTGTLQPAACKNPGGCRTCDAINRCRTVALDANCSCSDVPTPGAGPGITHCEDMNGTCAFR